MVRKERRGEEGRGGMEWEEREGRKRAVERGRKEENRSSGKMGGGRERDGE